MHFWQIKGRNLPRSATATISKGAQLALLLCGLLGIASVLLVAGGTMTPTLLPPIRMSRPEVKFAGMRRRHGLLTSLQVQGFWMDEHDVTRVLKIC
jgi:hypothetical protein